MTDIDKTLFAAENDRPAFFVLPGVTQFATFPSLASPKYLDWRVAMDLSRGGPLYGVFRVNTAFNNQADNLVRFAIFVDNDPTFAGVLTNPALIIARSHDLTPAGLASVGAFVQVATPPLSDFARAGGDGRQYMALGMEAVIPTADFVAGGIDAFFSPKPIQTRPIHYAAGW